MEKYFHQDTQGLTLKIKENLQKQLKKQEYLVFYHSQISTK
jgi:hypothetical protein